MVTVDVESLLSVFLETSFYWPLPHCIKQVLRGKTFNILLYNHHCITLYKKVLHGKTFNISKHFLVTLPASTELSKFTIAVVVLSFKFYYVQQRTNISKKVNRKQTYQRETNISKRNKHNKHNRQKRIETNSFSLPRLKTMSGYNHPERTLSQVSVISHQNLED